MSASALLDEAGDVSVLTKVAVFLVVQALVYLILSNSSDIFSRNRPNRSFSFRPARSVSILRILAAISDMPQGGASPPSASLAESSTTAFPEYPSPEDLTCY